MIFGFLSGNKLRLNNYKAFIFGVHHLHIALTIRMFCVALGVFLLSTHIVNMLANMKQAYLVGEYKIHPFTTKNQPGVSLVFKSKTNQEIQTTYQIMVAFSTALLSVGKPYYKDSMQVKSNAINQVEYSGKKFLSVNSSFWRVRSCDKSGKPGTWSVASKFQMRPNRVNSRHC
jgi:hypothetical protein